MTVNRRRLNIAHANGDLIIDIVALGHDTYKGRTFWFFKARCESDPDHILQVAPHNLRLPANGDRYDLDKALDSMEAYLTVHGLWNGRGWEPLAKVGPHLERPLTL